MPLKGKIFSFYYFISKLNKISEYILDFFAMVQYNRKHRNNFIYNYERKENLYG